MIKMQIYYSLSASTILNEKKFSSLKNLMKKAGVTHISIAGYFFGRFESSLGDIHRAREILERSGFEVSIISLPIGHPGNSLNPDDDTIDLGIPSHWRYRIDRFGNKVYHCADIEPNMIKDNINAIKELEKEGFSCFFMDDDIRVGNWGNEIQGCFCKDCISDFNEKYDINTTRDILSKKIGQRKKYKGLNIDNNSKLLEQWIEYNSNKLTNFISDLNISGIKLGVMVMHYGDERHGIDIKAIKKVNPNILIRVGEAHFGDNSFGSVKGKTSEIISILHHLNLAGNKNTYSETTIFPARRLSPSNWIFKAKLAMAAGVENLYLMGGTWVIEDDYWEILANNLPQIIKIKNLVKDNNPTFPIHVLKGDATEPIQVPHLPFTSGLPAKPVRLMDLNERSQLKDRILIILTRNRIKKKVEYVNILSKYTKIYVDKHTLGMNIDILSEIDSSKVQILNNFSKVFNFIPKLTHKMIQKNLRDCIKVDSKKNHFPFISNGRNIVLVWIKEENSLILINLEEKSKRCTLYFNMKERILDLKPYEFIIYSE